MNCRTSSEKQHLQTQQNLQAGYADLAVVFQNLLDSQIAFPAIHPTTD